MGRRTTTAREDDAPRRRAARGRGAERVLEALAAEDVLTRRERRGRLNARSTYRGEGNAADARRDAARPVGGRGRGEGEEAEDRTRAAPRSQKEEEPPKKNGSKAHATPDRAAFVVPPDRGTRVDRVRVSCKATTARGRVRWRVGAAAESAPSGPSRDGNDDDRVRSRAARTHDDDDRVRPSPLALTSRPSRNARLALGSSIRPSSRGSPQGASVMGL